MKLNKFKVGIIIFLIVLLLTIAVFGRFIYTSIREAYFLSRQFYFTSDILRPNGTIYRYSNWGGIDVYPIEFDLYSYNNELSRLDYDLEYTVTCESLTPEKATCSLFTEDGGTTANGVIYATTNTSRITVLVKPVTQVAKGDTVRIRVTASTQEPYQKEISCTFALYVELNGENSYVIEDAVNNEYALLKFVNGNDTAAQITIEFDPRKLRLDLNDEIYLNRVSEETTTINGNEYVNKVVFNFEAESAKNVKFYKVDKSQDYSYPGVNDNSPIQITL